MTDAVRRVWTGLVAVGPRAGDHRVALRAAVSVAVPLLVVWAMGRLDLSVYASFGAFAALYGRHDTYADRIRMQAAAAAVLLGAMLLGTSLVVVGAPLAVRVIVVSVIAAGVTLIAYAGRWHPPGALFAVFAAGTTASLPAQPGTLATVLVVGGASAAFGIGLTASLALIRRGARPSAAPVRRERRPLGNLAGEMALTVGVGALLAGLAGLLLVGTHWYWAMVGAVAALGGAHVTARIVRGVQRLAGTLVGVLVAAAILGLHLPPVLTILVAVVLQAGAEMFVGRNYGIAMVFITPLALLMVELAAPTDPTVLVRDRLLDTLIGVTIGTLVSAASATLRRTRSPGLG
ncbi:FUSC family protein [Microbacterium sp. cx-55]|uniref:FUSC family protein n=1 Tax=Microbacterium sp. cx-55 TaxID=2875948 RepID=UPI001CBAC612|nr:FUSC family protein [Microbacterium sp. cx-55]MBZ4486681.1 FUSC family protein [Microbacterium sp. cx-55]UGB36359.1 FUSC family protein [Microbacterium sp. cx-55]